MKTTSTASVAFFLAGGCLAAPAPAPAAKPMINLEEAAIDKGDAVLGADADSAVLEDRGSAIKSGDITSYDVGMGSCGELITSLSYLPYLMVRSQTLANKAK